MLTKLFLTTSYAEYWWRAKYKNGYGVHSPFVYNFIENIIEDDRKFYAYDDIRAIREDLCSWKEPIDYKEVGAASLWSGSSRKRLISDITKYSSVSQKYGELLFRISNYFKPKTILEFGTSVGISSLYLAAGSPNAKLRTYDINRPLVRIANANYNSLKLTNAKAELSLFEKKLSKLNKEFEDIDLIFLDGNHRKESTILYYNFFKNLITNNSVLIFDDIHWSKEMEEAWKHISQSKEVSLSIDLFQFGILFFRKEFMGNKQHFVIKF